MNISLYNYQIKAINDLKSGSILCGGVGSGKSRTSLAYYFLKECLGNIEINGKGYTSKMKNPKNLYIITTAKKRDDLEWDKECSNFMISKNKNDNINNVDLYIDSWNNISKYKDVKNGFFIFDEQRLVGSGTWAKSFLKIVKNNNWILLSATPGDTWSDYIPVFIANGFYKNRTEFLRRHAVYSRFTKYPKIEKYIECSHLNKLRENILVQMNYIKNTISYEEEIYVKYDINKYNDIIKNRWNPFNNKPIKTASEFCYIMRKIVNMNTERINAILNIFKNNKRLIIFYNFDYELEMLRELKNILKVNVKEWNGHNHDKVPEDKEWIYLVQYTAGAEGWNCITTNVIVFFSKHYSYKIMTQASGRIDRLNSPFNELYYYHITTTSLIDVMIKKAIKKKKNFNVYKFTNDNSKIYELA